MDSTLQQILNYLIALQSERNALVDEVTKLRAQVASQNGVGPAEKRSAEVAEQRA